MRERRVDTALRRAVYRRNYRRVRDRALTRLSRLYPDDYARLLAEERERDELEGKKWIDIGDSAVGRLDSAYQGGSRTTATEGTSDGSTSVEGNDGGEA